MSLLSRLGRFKGLAPAVQISSLTSTASPLTSGPSTPLMATPTKGKRDPHLRALEGIRTFLVRSALARSKLQLLILYRLTGIQELL